MSASGLRRPGFTLIELLIVVAIIAILAALAVPNFIEAHTRSKIARARIDMRTVAVALESYVLDYNAYPWAPPVNLDGYGNPRADAFLTIPDGLTTPMAYLTTHIPDVFKINKEANVGVNTGKLYGSGDSQDMTFYYANIRQVSSAPYNLIPAGGLDEALGIDGGWRLGALGPQCKFIVGTTGQDLYGTDTVYDPTNGTVSRGMIWRSQRNPEVKSFPSAPPLN
jgi:prepilin-type N-terminal cleavage/methylation domain-containing protein